MKLLSFLAVTLMSANAFSQSVSFNADSLNKVLCKKWLTEYAEMGGMRIGAMPGVVMAGFEFTADKKAKAITSDENSKEEKAIVRTWTYNPANKYISIWYNKKEDMRIVELTEGQMKLKVVAKSGVPSDLGDILLVLKPQN
jgi:hypothetical protein